MKINVLGTEYELKEIEPDNDPTLAGKDGYCDSSIKLCVVDAMNHYEAGMKENLADYKNSVKRHELIHAFLYESGLDSCSSWAQNEEMIDWIAIQAPKIFKAFKEADCL
jgi:hypothetical protein cdifQCD-7_02046